VCKTVWLASRVTIWKEDKPAVFARIEVVAADAVEDVDVFGIEDVVGMVDVGGGAGVV